MPSPPGTDSLPVVSDLSYELDGAAVRLKWTPPQEMAGGEAVISRARTKLSDGICDECPLVFQQVAVLTIQRRGDSLMQSWRDSLSSGFRYTYKVVLKTDSGRTGGPSNLVTFDY